MKKLTKYLVVLSLFAQLMGCSKPLPPSKQAYAGRWQSENMVLIITQGGDVSYKKQNGNTNTSIDAPLKEFTQAGFSVGVGFMSTDFVVNEKPHQVDGQWKMTVDGVVLTKVEG